MPHVTSVKRAKSSSVGNGPAEECHCGLRAQEPEKAKTRTSLGWRFFDCPGCNTRVIWEAPNGPQTLTLRQQCICAEMNGAQLEKVALSVGCHARYRRRAILCGSHERSRRDLTFPPNAPSRP